MLSHMIEAGAYEPLHDAHKLLYEDVTIGQCEAYEVTKLDHEYEDLSRYRNPTAEYELPITKCPAKNSLESDDTYI